MDARRSSLHRGVRGQMSRRTLNIERRTSNAEPFASAHSVRSWMFQVRCSMFFSFVSIFVGSALAESSTNLPPGVQPVPYDPKVFRPDPSYTNDAYNAGVQLRIYGDKRAVPTTRPMLEIGRELYRQGPFEPGYDWLGKKNL